MRVFGKIAPMEKRFFVEKQNILADTITLTDDEHLHLSKVMRLRVGDAVECFYDNSNVFECEIQAITKSATTLKIIGERECTQNPTREVVLFQALPKLDKLELVTQKGVELGLTKIVPFSSAYCVAKENINKIERLKKIVVSACKQCGRTKLLEVESPIKFKELLNVLKDFEVVLFANECEDTVSINEILNSVRIKGAKDLNRVAYVVGSEGGFSKEEIDELKKVATSVSLGKRILRTETAAIAMGAIILYELGEI